MPEPEEEEEGAEESEADEPAEEGAESEEEEESEEDDDPEIDLGDIKLRKSELKAGYMKDADYRRKTAEAAEAKREAQAVAEQVRQERSFYANHVDVALQLAQKQLIGDQAELADLARTDPAEWVARNAQFQQRAQEFNQLLQARQALTEHESADSVAQQNAWRGEQRELLKQKLPEWSDPKKAKAEAEIIGAYALNIGYSQEELSELFDHRALLVLRDAALARSQQAARESAKAKQTKSEPPKVIKPGAPKPTAQTRQKADELLARAKRTHGTDDAIAFLLARQKG